MKNILWLNEQDILQLDILNIESVIKIVERTLEEYANGEIKLYNKNSYVFDEILQNRINCLIAALEKYNVCGMKWVSVFPNNPKKYNLRKSKE